MKIVIIIIIIMYQNSDRTGLERRDARLICSEFYSFRKSDKIYMFIECLSNWLDETAHSQL